MFIARLLTPADIGVFSVTVVLLSFVATVRDLGAGGYLVQERELTIDRIRAVWTIQLGLGLILGLIVLIASVPAATFYSEPRMRNIMVVTAFNYIVNPFGSLTYAWQIREMRFDTLAIVRFSSTLTGAVVSVYLAWRGIGPISLALGSLASTLVNATMAIYFRPKWFPWLPGLKEIKRVLAYGTQTTAASIIQTIDGTASELLLAKLQSMTVTGLFSRAFGLITMFDRLVLIGVTSVAISWFSQQSRDVGSISRPFLKATSYITAIGWSFCFGIIFLAQPVMRLLYGPQWDGAVDVTRLMAVSLLVGLPAAMCMPVLMALGHARSFLIGTAITAAISIALVAIGAYFGLMQLGTCLILVSVAKTVYWLTSTRQFIKFEWAEFSRTLGASAVVGIGAGIAPTMVFLIYGWYPDSLLVPLVIGVTGAAIGFFSVIFIIKHPLKDELIGISAKVRRFTAPSNPSK